MENTQERVETNEQNEVVKGTKRFKKVKGELPPFAKKMPETYTNLVRIIKNNAEIRRFTALGILNYLTQKGVINGEKKYVTFKWNKFTVTTDGWSREFSYKQPFFINCLVAAFSCFANSANKTIEDFVNSEIINGREEITPDAAENIVNDIKDSKASPVEEEEQTQTETETTESNE